MQGKPVATAPAGSSIAVIVITFANHPPYGQHELDKSKLVNQSCPQLKRVKI